MEKVLNFTKPTFPKKGVGKLKKNHIFGITKASAFEWYASFVLSPPTPSRPCTRRNGARPLSRQRGPTPPNTHTYTLPRDRLPKTAQLRHITHSGRPRLKPRPCPRPPPRRAVRSGADRMTLTGGRRPERQLLHSSDCPLPVPRSIPPPPPPPPPRTAQNPGRD